MNTSTQGLSQEEVGIRLERYGFNELVEAKKPSLLKLFLEQFTDILIIILLVAVAVSFVVGEMVDASLILVIVFASALLGFTQEYRAEKALEALKKMLSPTATVLRDGEVRVVSAKEIVPGDVLILKEGDKVAADAKLIHVTNLKVNEAALTGESVPVQKTVGSLPAETVLAERRNMVFSGTEVTYGKGRAVVVATGMNTEFGKIAEQVATVVKGETPLEERTKDIGKWLGILSLGVCIALIIVGILRELLLRGTFSWDFALKMVLFGIALAVAAVPEALPAVVTGSLAIGMHRMAKRNALVRKMAAVETLGCTTVICSDKTGTLTKGEMTVRELYVADREVEVTGVGYEPKGRIHVKNEGEGLLKTECFSLLMKGFILCNDAGPVLENGKWKIRGDPTEGALVVVAEKAGFRSQDIRSRYPRIGEVPFSSERKRMTTVHLTPEDEKIVFMKGAPELVLERCAYIHGLGGIRRLTSSDEERILKKNEEMAERALRVLALAYRKETEIKSFDEEALERDLIFLGLAGMIDPPREEAIEAIKVCKQVGIKPIMITGDHKLTAVAIAKEMGIYQEGDVVLTGGELEKMSEENLERIVEKVTVYARVSPIHKLKIVQAWKRKGEVVAMTGDGVNDAPALKQADMGVAMGITGTEVTKEAADLVLADDNFATIVGAVELGRWIYDNIKKYLAYLLRANLIEIIVLSVAVLIGYPLPLLPVQILYINLVTDGFPAIALGISPPDPDIMRRPPRNPQESIFTKDVKIFYLVTALIQSPIFLYIFMSRAPIGVSEGAPALIDARTIIFFLFVFCELALALSCRSLKYTIWEARPHGILLASIVGNAVLTAALFGIPVVAQAFEISPIGLVDVEIVIIVCLVAVISIEALKCLMRKFESSDESGGVGGGVKGHRDL